MYKKLSHSVWLCAYHIVFCPKFRFKILSGRAEVIVRNELYRLCDRKDQIYIEEINIQEDHVHMILSIPPKYAISDIMGMLKGKTAIKLFDTMPSLRKRYWGVITYGQGDIAYPRLVSTKKRLGNMSDGSRSEINSAK